MGTKHTAHQRAEIIGGGLQRFVADNAFPELGTVADALQEVELEVAQDKVFIIFAAESLQRFKDKDEERKILLAFGGELVDKLGNIPMAMKAPFIGSRLSSSVFTLRTWSPVIEFSPTTPVTTVSQRKSIFSLRKARS